MVIVFSLPFCLLLPDGDYEVKLAENDTVIINLTKVIPKIFDERLPCRGFVKGELENISRLRIVDMQTDENREIDVHDLSDIRSIQKVIYYITKDGKRITPSIQSECVNKDVNLFDNVIIDPEKFKRVIVNDFDEDSDITDQILSQKREFGRSITINCEVTKDRFGRFRYSRVRYTSLKKLHYEEEFKRAVRAINLLVDKYRSHTGDYWITRIREKDIFIYMDVSDDSLDFSHVEKGISNIQPDHNSEVVDSIKKELIDMTPDFPFIHLMLDAQNAYEEGKYHLSIIYAITSLESLAKTCLAIYLNKKYPEIEEQILKMHLSLLVSIILRFIIPSDQLKSLIPDIKSAITLRNKIIHEAELNVSDKQAKTIIENVNKFSRYIAAHFDNLLFPK